MMQVICSFSKRIRLIDISSVSPFHIKNVRLLYNTEGIIVCILLQILFNGLLTYVYR
jgi:hypothetical protein